MYLARKTAPLNQAFVPVVLGFKTDILRRKTRTPHLAVQSAGCSLFSYFRAQLPALLRIAQSFLCRQGLVNSTGQCHARLCEHPCPSLGSRKTPSSNLQKSSQQLCPCSGFCWHRHSRSKLLLARKRFSWTLTRPQFRSSCKTCPGQKDVLRQGFFATALYAFARVGDLPRWQRSAGTFASAGVSRVAG